MGGIDSAASKRGYGAPPQNFVLPTCAHQGSLRPNPLLGFEPLPSLSPLRGATFLAEPKMAEREGLARCARSCGLTPTACPIYASLRQTLCSGSNPSLSLPPAASHFSLERKMAEREGFEPSVPFPVHSISNAAQSAALSPLLSKQGSGEVRGWGADSQAQFEVLIAPGRDWLAFSEVLAPGPPSLRFRPAAVGLEPQLTDPSTLRHFGRLNTSKLPDMPSRSGFRFAQQ